MRASTAPLLALLNRWPRRLAVLALLLLAGSSALAAYRPAAARSGAAEVTAVTVAARTLPAGATLAAGDLRLARWPRGLVPEQAVPRPAAIVGRRLAGPVAAGEALTSPRLVGADLAAGLRPGSVACSVSLGAEVTGFVRSGDTVDLLTAPDAEAVPSSTGTATAAAIVARGVVVLAVLPPPAAASQPAGSQLVIATDRRTAVRVAALQGRALLAVLADPP